MSLQLVSKLNLHFFENISTHPVVRNDDTRDSALASFNQAINLYKPASAEERAVADFFRESFDNNQYATMTYLRRMNYLGLSQFISGRCVAMALGIENKIHIVTDKNGCYVSKISNRRDRARRPRRDDAQGGQGAPSGRQGGQGDRRDSDRQGGQGGRRDSDRQGGQGGRRDQKEPAPFRPRLQFSMDALVGTVHWPVGTSWADITDDDEFDTPPTPPPKEAVDVAAATSATASMSLTPSPRTPPVTPKTSSETPAPLPTPELE